MGNVPVTAGFMIATAGQFVFGVYVLAALAKTGGKVENFHQKNRLIPTGTC